MGLEIVYWSLVVLAVYPYLIYPVIALLMARIRRRSVRRETQASQPVSIVVAAHNEAHQIGRRIAELSQFAAEVHPQSEVIVVSDGSTDGTAEVVRLMTEKSVKLIELSTNQGKAQALNAGVAASRHEFVAFADVRQAWNRDTLPTMLSCFADPGVGAVSGDLRLRSTNGSLAGVDIYWKLEKLLRVCESRWHSTIGVTGAVCAVRRSLFTSLPPGTVLDDVYWPLGVVLQGWRVVHESAAIAEDRLPDEITSEYRRKLRTLAGNFQLLSLRPSLLLPWKNPVWFQFVSHKIWRLVTPWLLLIAWGISFALANRPIYAVVFAGETIAIAAGALAWLMPPLRRFRLLGVLSAVFALNFAAGLAFWIWLTGSTSRTWKKVKYDAGDDRMQRISH